MIASNDANKDQSLQEDPCSSTSAAFQKDSNEALVPSNSNQVCNKDIVSAPSSENPSKATESVSGKPKSRSRKRLNSFNGQSDNGKHKNKRQSINGAGEIILPNKFLLGGNITDPLNLNSMLDEKVNKSLNASTPSSSPLPPRNSKINMIIPDDMTDPLGLNSNDEAVVKSQDKQQGVNKEGNSKGRRKRRRRKSSLNDKSRPENNADGSIVESVEEEIPHCNSTPNANRVSKGKKGKSFQKLELQQLSHQPGDPIVSPVVPQDVKNSENRIIDPQTPRSRRKRSSLGTKKSPSHSRSVDDDKSSNSTSTPTKGSRQSNSTMEGKKLLTASNSKGDVNKNQIKSDQKPAHKEVLKSSVSVKKPDSTKKAKDISSIKFKPHQERYQFGNYNKYYGYRNEQKFTDPRMSLFEKEWFKDKDVLDVGCNVGHLTLLIARDYCPRKIVGVDIDEHLIKAARNNIRHYATAMKRPPQSNVVNYPSNMALMFGPIVGPNLETGKGDSAKFPNNITFLQGNYVPLKKELVQFQEPEYDVIMCMSVTKWIHLNWGDKGLQDTFMRFFKQLRPGGLLILEPQDWKSYTKKKKLTERIYRNFTSIEFKPPQFPRYLIKEIGFEKVEYLNSPFNTSAASKGFQRSVQVYYKPE